MKYRQMHCGKELKENGNGKKGNVPKGEKGSVNNTSEVKVATRKKEIGTVGHWE